jgi:hypothetical protein
VGFVRDDAVRKCVLGGTGGGGIGGKARQGSVSVIARAAAAVVPALIIAAVPRDLRVDPCEEKSKRDEFSRMRQRSVAGRGRGRGSRKHDGCYLLLRKRSDEVHKNMRFYIGDAPPPFNYDPPRGYVNTREKVAAVRAKKLPLGESKQPRIARMIRQRVEDNAFHRFNALLQCFFERLP